MANIILAGTSDTKGAELAFLKSVLRGTGHEVKLVDVGIHTPECDVDVSASVVAGSHPDGIQFLGTNDRGAAVAAMGTAFAAYCKQNAGNISGIIGLGGGGGTSILTAGMRALPLGIPKVMVSTLASGDTAPYVDISDIMMVPAITDIAGLNSVSRGVLYRAAQAIIGMVDNPAPLYKGDKPPIGLTMFGVTTPCVTAVSKALSSRFDPMIFHATGTGGRAMEQLASEGAIAGVVDVTLTEICDLLFGGVLPALDSRLNVIAAQGIPWVGSAGALDMVNFGAPETIPTRFKDRKFYYHNPQVTLMRTTVEENAELGLWIARKLNACPGEVRMLLPENGVSAIDIEGGPFRDAEADAALFDAIEATVDQNEFRQVKRLPFHINDPEFADALAGTFNEIYKD